MSRVAVLSKLEGILNFFGLKIHMPHRFYVKKLMKHPILNENEIGSNFED